MAVLPLNFVHIQIAQLLALLLAVDRGKLFAVVVAIGALADSTRVSHHSTILRQFAGALFDPIAGLL